MTYGLIEVGKMSYLSLGSKNFSERSAELVVGAPAVDIALLRPVAELRIPVPEIVEARPLAKRSVFLSPRVPLSCSSRFCMDCWATLRLALRVGTRDSICRISPVRLSTVRPSESIIKFCTRSRSWGVSGGACCFCWFWAVAFPPITSPPATAAVGTWLFVPFFRMFWTCTDANEAATRALFAASSSFLPSRFYHKKTTVNFI